MGANEERIRNLRKREQIEKIMKTRSNNNSKSIATRKRSEQVQPKSPMGLDRSKSKERKKDSGHKISTSKDLVYNNNNLDEILFNMNKNVTDNLNKLESPGNFRSRKWGEPKNFVGMNNTNSIVKQRNFLTKNKQGKIQLVMTYLT